MTKPIFTAVASAALFGAGAASAQELTFEPEQIKAAEACMTASLVQEGTPMLCSCAPDAMSGSVWGTMTYTSDSNVCAAALHAGAVTPEGGVVVVSRMPGQDSYTGTQANGITTRDWGNYGSSFVVTAAVAKSTLAQCGVMPSDVDTLSCACPPADGSSGSVWGYGPYTADSDICTAARHAGYIDRDGGPVSVLRIQGLDSYTGGSSNGVTTSDWRAYGSSIVFDWNAP